jgi:hypothetical protein
MFKNRNSALRAELRAWQVRARENIQDFMQQVLKTLSTPSPLLS